MNQLIKVHHDEQDNPMISGRELHEFLEVETRYNDWFPRMAEYGFDEGKDFYSKMSESTGGRPALDHILTITMAKELCMLQRTEKGKQARQYFIQLENAWNTPEMVMARALKMADKQILYLSAQVEEMKPLAAFAQACQKSDDSLLVRDVAKIASKNGFEIGERRLYQKLREWGLIYRDGGRNLPYQRYITQGLFEVTETPCIVDGETRLFMTLRVTAKGQQYIINKLQ